MAVPSIYTGVTTQDQTAAANKTANATANRSVMGDAQTPSMSATSQPGIIAGAMGAPAPTTPATPASAPDYTAQLNDLYTKELGRNADPGGMQFYANNLANGSTTLEGVDKALLNSAEYKSLHPTNQQTAYTPTMLAPPTQWSVTPDQTVQGQMKNLIDPNNPYYQQWATAGAQDAAARGFTGNSSIRDTGIIDAVMRGATPIATSDASTYSKAAGYNTDQSNQFAVDNQNAANTAGQVNANLGVSLANAGTSANTTKYTADQAAATSKYGADTTAATQKYLSDQNAATQLAVQKMSTQSQQTVSQLHDANSVLLQNNQSAQAAYTAYINAVANIDIQPSMDKDAKGIAIARETMIFNQAIAGLKAATPGTPDTTSPLDVSAYVQDAIKQAGGEDVSHYLKFDN
ncbi:DUF4214 domain-containing protein [Duganella sp. S19_KUP01_CR8]|uniref:DUF4214 domain-containing protein n=1 Tax=Duganella sp. S19_KUP01_CR8 TaxID=3025502 RepID=UPI002FCD834F